MRRLLPILMLAATLFALYLPIVTIAVYSFNDSKRSLVWRGFTLRHYASILRDGDLLWSSINSLLIAAATGALSLFLAASFSYAMWRFQFVLRYALHVLLVMSIAIPEMCVGVATMIFFSHLGWFQNLIWPLDLIPIIIGHTVLTFPFVAIMFRSRLETISFELLEAAMDLGSREWGVFFRIIAPNLYPCFVAGFFLAVSLSLDDFPIAFFTAESGTTTLPIKIYSMMRFAVPPGINAILTIFVVVTSALALLTLILQRHAARVGAGAQRYERKE